MAAEHVKRLGERIRVRREELGLTQEEVARSMPGKVSGSRISLWERGENKPRDDSLEHLAQVLNTTVSALTVPAPHKGATPDLLAGDALARLAQVEHRITQQLAEHAKRVEDLLEVQNEILARISDAARKENAAAERIDAATQRAVETAGRLEQSVAQAGRVLRGETPGRKPGAPKREPKRSRAA